MPRFSTGRRSAAAQTARSCESVKASMRLWSCRRDECQSLPELWPRMLPYRSERRLSEIDRRREVIPLAPIKSLLALPAGGNCLQPARDQTADNTADDWGDPEQPQARQRNAATENCCCCRTRRIDGCIADRDGDEVNHGQRQADRQRREPHRAVGGDHVGNNN